MFAHRLESCATQIVLCGGWELVSRALRYKIKFDNLISLRNTGRGEAKREEDWTEGNGGSTLRQLGSVFPGWPTLRTNTK